MSDDHKFSVQEEIDAWFEWKEKCDIGLCSYENQTYLSRRVHGSLSRYLSKYESGMTKAASLVHIFDCFINIKELAGKEHKNETFALAEKSQDPFMKVINGKLLGPNSIIRDIAREYIIKELGYRETESKDKKRRYKQDESIFRPIGDKNGLTYLDVLANDSIDEDYITAENADAIIEKIICGLKKEEKIILFADCHNISLDTDEVKSATGRSKSQNYEIKEKAYQKIKTIQADNFFTTNDVGLANQLLIRINSDLEAEKACAQLLLSIKEKQEKSKNR
jgi:hypothetical protein